MTKTKKLNSTLFFNKENAKLFADKIYSDQNGQISFLKLCKGDLSNGKEGNRTLHCALGEAYFTFVDPNVAGFVKKIETKYGETVSYETCEEDSYKPKYGDPGICDHTATLAVVDALVDAALLRSSYFDNKKKLAEALLDTMQSNDNVCGTGLGDDLMNRAMDVADTWREKVVPLLK